MILYHFIFLPRRSRRASRRCMTGEVRFRDRLWSHPGHVSCLIGTTPLNCLRRTIARRRLTHCDYASRRWCLSRAPNFVPRFISSPRVSFRSPFFFSLLAPISLPFWFLRERSVSSFAIRSEDPRLPFFVSRYREISRIAESLVIIKIFKIEVKCLR